MIITIIIVILIMKMVFCNRCTQLSIITVYTKKATKNHLRGIVDRKCQKSILKLERFLRATSK